jgi:hypothetical protein
MHNKSSLVRSAAILLGVVACCLSPAALGGAAGVTVSNQSHRAQAAEPPRVLPGDAGLNPGAGRAAGGSFRLSFLESDVVLEDTCRLLARHGFPPETVQIFRRLARGHNQHGNRVDRTRFPESQAGWYEFRDLDDLTRRLACPLGQTPATTTNSVEENTLTCFDFVSLLLHDAVHQVPTLARDFESNGFVLATSMGLRRSVGYPEWSAAFRSLLYPENGYVYLVGRARSEPEALLNLTMRAAVQIQATNSVQAMARDAVSRLSAALKRSGFVFPTEFTLGLAFFVNPERDWAYADHAFLCFANGNRLVCLEKVGSRGPYVRAEFGSAEDLARFVSWDELQPSNAPNYHERGSSVAVSLNDRLLGVWPK